ncbi:MAG: hypothetical protein ACI39C_07355 [Dietzia sp.]
MTYSYSTDRLVKIGGKWIRVSAVQAVAKTIEGRTGIYLAGGARIDVGDIHGSISPDDVVERLESGAGR